jgi:hypothetical protein
MITTSYVQFVSCVRRKAPLASLVLLVCMLLGMLAS